MRPFRGQVDVLTGGFPCQSFSTMSAERLGLEDDTTGSMIFHVLRVMDECRPKAVILENVKGLVTGFGDMFEEVIVKKLREVGDGYRVHWRIVD